MRGTLIISIQQFISCSASNLVIAVGIISLHAQCWFRLSATVFQLEFSSVLFIFGHKRLEPKAFRRSRRRSRHEDEQPRAASRQSHSPDRSVVPLAAIVIRSTTAAAAHTHRAPLPWWLVQLFWNCPPGFRKGPRRWLIPSRSIFTLSTVN